MTRYEHKGAASYVATLTADITAVSTSLSISDATGWPTGAANKFWIVINPGTATEEKCLVTSRSGTTLNGLTRAQDDTTAASHLTGESVQHIFTATEADAANAHVNDTTRDDHTQYVHNTTARTVSAAHTFSGGPTFSTVAPTFSAGASLAGTLSGTPTFSGAVVFSGNPNFTGSPTFNTGTPTFNNGASLGTGTYSGSATFSGVLTFSSATGIRTGTTVTTANAKAGVIALSDIPSALGGNPANGGYLYSNSGALTWRGPSGTVTVVAPA